MPLPSYCFLWSNRGSIKLVLFHMTTMDAAMAAVRLQQPAHPPAQRFLEILPAQPAPVIKDPKDDTKDDPEDI